MLMFAFLPHNFPYENLMANFKLFVYLTNSAHKCHRHLRSYRRKSHGERRCNEIRISKYLSQGLNPLMSGGNKKVTHT